MKVKVLLFLVIVYLAGAFSWWTYSLINLSKLGFEANNRNMDIMAHIVLKDVIKQFSTQNQQFNGYGIIADNEIFFTDTLQIHKFIDSKYGEDFLAKFTKVPSQDDRIELLIKPGLSMQSQNLANYTSRKRAYYSEAAFFMLLILVGFVWIFRSLEKIINLNKLQRNFMLAVTHELKTPIAALKLVTQTLLKRNLDAEKSTQLIHKADDNANRLDKLIEGLLVAVKIENRSLETAFSSVDVKHLIEEIILEMQSIKFYHGEILNKVSEDFKVWGDRQSLRLTFVNIIENAVKYAAGPVQLEIYSKGKELYFADNGPGIPPSERKKVFTQFYRIGNENERVAPGTGMGLYLVKNILKIHKAHISVTANQPQGTIFKIKFR